MATPIIDAENNEINVKANGNAAVVLNTAGTYVDKNIVFNINGITVTVKTIAGKNVLVFDEYGD